MLLTVAVTVLTGLDYVVQAVRIARAADAGGTGRTPGGERSSASSPSCSGRGDARRRRVAHRRAGERDARHRARVSRAVLRGAVVAYATDLKAELLGVDPDLLAAHGPVHPEVAAADGPRRGPPARRDATAWAPRASPVPARRTGGPPAPCTSRRAARARSGCAVSRSAGPRAGGPGRRDRRGPRPARLRRRRTGSGRRPSAAGNNRARRAVGTVMTTSKYVYRATPRTAHDRIHATPGPSGMHDRASAPPLRQGTVGPHRPAGQGRRAAP